MSTAYKYVQREVPYTKCDKCGFEINADKALQNEKERLTLDECDQIETQIVHTVQHIEYDKFTGRSKRYPENKTRFDLCPECYEKFLEWIKEK